MVSVAGLSPSLCLLPVISMIGGHVTESEEQVVEKKMSVTGTGKKGVSFLLSTSSAVESQDESTLPLFKKKSCGFANNHCVRQTGAEVV